MDLNQTRKYIHDLANSLSVVDASLSRVTKMLSEKLPEDSEELRRLAKANENLKKSIGTLRDLRQLIHSEINSN